MKSWKPVTEFTLGFDLSALDELHDFVHEVALRYNAGFEKQPINVELVGWHGHFVAGELGLKVRLFGVSEHYRLIHAWIPKERTSEEIDYHLATILFGMDSAIECCTFVLNALGWAVLPSEFLNVNDDNALRNITPDNIVGAGKKKISGYAKVFPRVEALWNAPHNKWLLGFIFEQHNASKHRQATIVGGGEQRDDPPTGFFEAVGAEDQFTQQLYTPQRELFLIDCVGKPNTVRKASLGVRVYRLEDLAPDFCKLIQDTGRVALLDAKKHILLRRTSLVAV